MSGGNYDFGMTSKNEGYGVSKAHAIFALFMVTLMMILDFGVRQMIVALFPQLKVAWTLSDQDLAALSSVVPAVVSVAVLPVAIIVDRWSRVGSIVAMGAIWSLSTLAGGWATNYGQLLASRAVMGFGEAGYGPAGTVLLSAHFPKRLHGRVFSFMYMGASVGAVAGVVAGGTIAQLWSWREALLAAGVASLLASFAFVFVRDFRSVKVAGEEQGRRRSAWRDIAGIFAVPTALFGIAANTAQLFVVGAMVVWLPSFFSRAYGYDVAAAGGVSAAILLGSSLAAILWAALADMIAQRSARWRAVVPAVLVSISAAFFAVAFLRTPHGNEQVILICAGAAFMMATYGTLNAVVLDVVDPAARATSQGILSLFQNVFGLAAGPFVAGALSDRIGLQAALAIVPLASVLASGACFGVIATYPSMTADVRDERDLAEAAA